MVRLVNRAKMTTATTGTGTITLGTASGGFQTFTGAGVVDGDLVRYVIEEGDNFEIGTGVFGSAGGTLTRNPSESSAGGGAITLTGNALVFVGAASADVQSDVTINGGTIDGTVIGGSTPAAISGTTGSFTTTIDVTGVGSADTLRLGSRSVISVPDRGGVARTPPLMISGSTFASTAPSVAFYNTTNPAGLFNFLRSNTATVGNHAISSNGQAIGTLQWAASDGTDFIRAAQIEAVVDGTPSTNNMPARLVFSTTPIGSSVPAERMRINSAGNVGIGNTTPAERLHVTGNILASGTSSTTKNIFSTTSQQIEVRAGNSVSFLDADFAEVTSQVVAARFFRNTNTTGTKTIRFHRGDGTTAEDARIGVGTANTFFGIGGGNVGIGTSSPLSLLDVVDVAPIFGNSRTTNSNKFWRPRIPTFAGTNAGSDFFTPLFAACLDGSNIVEIGGGTGTAFAATEIRFRTAANETTTNGSERMRITSAGNVGIGTSSPNVNLHLVANLPSFEIQATGADAGRQTTRIANDAGNIRFSTRTSTGGFVSNDYLIDKDNSGATAHIWRISNTESMRINSAGNVGIGTSSPLANLHVQGGSISASDSLARFGLTAGFNSFLVGYAGAGDPTDEAPAIYATSTTGFTGQAGHIVYKSRSGAAARDHIFLTGSTPAERLRITSAGNVGIGTSSPSQKLSVTGNVTISGSLSKGSGSFKIDHPIKPDTHHLVHSFIEGPQADNLYRGKVSLIDGIATVNLDEAGRMTEGTFVALNGNVQCFTANEAGWTQVRGKVEGNILTIEAQDPACTDGVSWLVIGERHDPHMIDANWTDEQGRVITEPEKVIDIELETNND